MREVIIALVSSSITIVITSFFNYHFRLRQEIRNESVKYTTEILKNVYTPILKILLSAIVPGDGYDGITKEMLFEIEAIMKRNYELVDPHLHSIIWSLKTEVRREHYEESLRLFDKNKTLLTHVEHHFNFYRKRIGLPFDKTKLTRTIT
ncbi:hypothetical protein [Sporosarcina beigongshangi]|uniref:hypothetical protein n=1 Tax=Sporosarcina beigongshangi TaxID=2782538 RepID=UPI00193AD37D|nr:hypothetical protein [Sporosarcina beigongshangi]